MIPTKICGITTHEDALLATDLGASAIGFIFYPASPRYITSKQAGTIIAETSKGVRKVGVFVNTQPEEINRIVAETGIDMVQLSGNEPPESCQKIIVPVIKALHIGSNFNIDLVEQYDVRAFLLDTYQADRYGGTGKSFNWTQVSSGTLPGPTILSGGLTPENVMKGIKTLLPSAVDFNSGIEVRPGVKDRAKMENLFAILRKIKEPDEQVF
jgi:phosphoribosylanthranilate isomerase